MALCRRRSNTLVVPNMNKEDKKMMLKTLLVAFLVGLGMFLISLIFTLIFNSIGWSIGIAIGVAIELFNIYLLYVGTYLIEKSKKPALSVLFYIARTLLVGIGVLICVILGYGIKGHFEPVSAFQYSLFGLLIGYTPLQIIVSVVELKRKTNN